MMKKTYAADRQFVYSRLRARTIEQGYSDKDVAHAANMTPSTYSIKINGKGQFTQEQICDICDFLCISYVDIPIYFFALGV